MVIFKGVLVIGSFCVGEYDRFMIFAFINVWTLSVILALSINYLNERDCVRRFNIYNNKVLPQRQ